MGYFGGSPSISAELGQGTLHINFAGVANPQDGFHLKIPVYFIITGLAHPPNQQRHFEFGISKICVLTAVITSGCETME